MKNSTAKGLPPRSGPQGGVVGKRKSTVDAGTDAAGKASETNKKPRVLQPTTTTSAPPPKDSDGVIITPVALTEKVDDDLSISEKVNFIMGVMLANDRLMKKLECNNEGLSADKQKLETRVGELEVTNKKLGEDLRQAASDLTLSKANMQKHLDLVYKSLDDLSVKHESLKMSESMLHTQVGVSESLKSQLLSQVEDLGAEKSVLVSQVEDLGAEKSVLVSQVEKLEAEKSVLVSQVEKLEAEKSSTLWWDLDTDTTEKYKKYEADYVRRIKAKYFSKKNLYGGNVFENKTTIENEVIKSSRWPSTRSYTDPVQSFEDHSRSLSSINFCSRNLGQSIK